MEQWRPVVEVDNYEVSSLGNIRRNNKILKGCLDRGGYRHFCLSVDGKQKMYQGHTLVASSFLGKRPDGNDVDHIDNNRQNNCLDNLRYLTHQQNCMRKSNTNPLRNINRHGNKYRVIIAHIIYGSFDTIEEAVQKRDQILSQVFAEV